MKHRIVVEYDTYDNADERHVEAKKRRYVGRIIKAIPHGEEVQSARIEVDGVEVAEEHWTEWQ